MVRMVKYIGVYFFNTYKKEVHAFKKSVESKNQL